ncbi:hypothetical protein RFI_38209, partial [Reticulomyxa filosa]
NTTSVAFVNRKQQNKSVRNKSWKQRHNKTKNNNSIIEPAVKKDKVIAWQVYGPRSLAQDWTIGEKLTERRYSFKVTAEKEIVLDVNEKLSCVALNYDDQLKKAKTSSDLERNYKLSDVQIITVGAERFGCQEVVFKLNFIGFETSIAKGRHKKGYVCVKKKREIQGQARQHARLCYLFGIEQLIACVGKTDCPSINYAQEG